MARPTFVVDGQARARLADGLLSMSIAENVDGLYRCEATFGNWGAGTGTTLDYLYFDRTVLDFGKTLVVKLDNDTLFEGTVTGLEGQFPSGRSPEVTVLAEDRLQDLRMTRRTRSFADVSDAAAMRQIAGDYGLTADVTVNGPTHKILAQVNQSDLAFIRERAHALDAEVWVNGRTLHVKPRADRRETTVTLAYRIDLSAFSVLADLAHQRTTVTVAGWDVAGKSAITHDATDSIVSGELDGGKSGASLLKSAFGERKETIAHQVPLTADDAQYRGGSGVPAARAPVHHRARRRRDDRGDQGRREGRCQRRRPAVQRQVLPDRRAASVRRQRAAQRIHGRAPGAGAIAMLLDSRLESQIDRQGTRGAATRWYGVYPALVSDIKDPDNQGRVKVTLPWSPDSDGGEYEVWARLATMMGGNNRGSWFIPDANDEVLVVFEAGDPTRPYVIGGLWNGTDSPPERMDGSGKNYKKVISSRNGVKVTLDDNDGRESLVLETPGGQKIDVQGRAGERRNRRQQRQLGEAGVERRDDHRLGEGDDQREHDGHLGRDGHRRRRHVEVQRRGAGRHRHQQQRRLVFLHAGRRQHLVTSCDTWRNGPLPPPSGVPHRTAPRPRA